MLDETCLGYQAIKNEVEQFLVEFTNHFSNQGTASKKRRRTIAKLLVIESALTQSEDTQFISHLVTETLRKLLRLIIIKESGTTKRTPEWFRQHQSTCESTAVNADCSSFFNVNKEQEKLKQRKVLFLEDLDNVFQDEIDESFFQNLQRLVLNSRIPIICSASRLTQQLKELDDSIYFEDINTRFVKVDLGSMLKSKEEMLLISKMILMVETMMTDAFVEEHFLKSKPSEALND